MEIHDQLWCPVSLRDALTDNLQFYLNLGNHYAPVVPLLRRALKRTGARRIVDLCSGGGGPWLRLHRALDAEGEQAIDVVLTDKFPNHAALEWARAATAGRVHFYPDPVDATRVPAGLDGFRTLFTSFHHFRPEEARAILRDAVLNRQGVAVFEVTARRPIAILAGVMVPLLVLLSAPFIRPFRWSRLAWTYLPPVLPIVATFDGIVSCLRTYDPAELRVLTAGLTDDGYTWEIGELPGWRSPVPVTYLIGVPGRVAAPPPGVR